MLTYARHVGVAQASQPYEKCHTGTDAGTEYRQGLTYSTLTQPKSARLKVHARVYAVGSTNVPITPDCSFSAATW